MRAYSWEQLATATLRRQFPRVRGRGEAAVVELVGRVGPIQSQVARAPFVTVSSRLPGATYASVNAAYESYEVVRGSSLRGTVHTCVRAHHPLLDTVTRRALANLWRKGLNLSRVAVDDVQAELAAFATGEWRTPKELRAHLVDWLRAHEAPEAVTAAGTAGGGRAMAHLHSALIRRPVSGSAWDRQTEPGYRVAADVWEETPSPWLDDPDGALVALTRQHLAAFGPANRRDIAWWSGERLANVDAALATLADELTARPGPDGETYHDLVERPPGGDGDPGVRLLPEYDALVVGYDPKSRERFLSRDELGYVWSASNGGFSAFVLADRRIQGSWRLVGSGMDRLVQISRFPGARLVESDFTDTVAALEAALGVTVRDVRVQENESSPAS